VGKCARRAARAARKCAEVEECAQEEVRGQEGRTGVQVELFGTGHLQGEVDIKVPPLPVEPEVPRWTSAAIYFYGQPPREMVPMVEVVQGRTWSPAWPMESAQVEELRWE
jgi:hypothetical protein